MECKQMSRPIVYQLGSCQSRSRAIAEAFPTTFFTKLFDGAVFYYYYYYYYYYLNQGKTPGNSKITKRWWKVFGSGPYSGRSSSIKPWCSKTELNRCTITEIRWNKNEEARTSPVVSTSRLPNLLKNWKASLLIGPWDSTAIGTKSLSIWQTETTDK